MHTHWSPMIKKNRQWNYAIRIMNKEKENNMLHMDWQLVVLAAIGKHSYHHFSTENVVFFFIVFTVYHCRRLFSENNILRRFMHLTMRHQYETRMILFLAVDRYLAKFVIYFVRIKKSNNNNNSNFNNVLFIINRLSPPALF